VSLALRLQSEFGYDSTELAELIALQVPGNGLDIERSGHFRMNVDVVTPGNPIELEPIETRYAVKLAE
jgi:hypothetical protein